MRHSRRYRALSIGVAFAVILAFAAFVYAMAPATLGLYVPILLHRPMEIAPYVGALLLGWVGFSSAQEKALKLRFDAQMALCQAKVEENTRLVKV